MRVSEFLMLRLHLNSINKIRIVINKLDMVSCDQENCVFIDHWPI